MSTLDAGIKGTGRKKLLVISAVMMVFFSSAPGTVAALLQVLKSYVERKPTLELELELSGNKLKIKAEHLSPEQIEQTLPAVKQLCEAEPRDSPLCLS